MRLIGIEDWKRWRADGCTRVPAIGTRADEILPSHWSGHAQTPCTALLESAQGGRYSFLCDQPSRLIVGWDTGAEIRSGDGRLLIERRAGKPLDVLQALTCEQIAPELPAVPPMTGGWIGLFGYDLIHTWEKLPVHAKRDLGLPLYVLLEANELFAYDHHERTLTIAVWSDAAGADADLEARFSVAQRSIEAAYARWQRYVADSRAEDSRRTVVPASDKTAQSTPSALLDTSFSPDAFEAAVRRIHEYIAAGDSYQVNLSLRASKAATCSPNALYEALRRVNPSPYMGLFRAPGFALVCGSPELLVRSVGGVISSRPIAGTRPRGVGPSDDARYLAELFASDKERAEHLMLVDLIRNDIGRVAEFGSVHVSEFMAAERYSHVMHIVSQVEGRLVQGKGWTDVLQAMFPGGTITGCPKLRTIEIIEELEPVGRGFYTGALGWINFRGEMELNIVIRSMLVRDGVVHVQSGAGIVADSRPDRELDEVRRKAQALWVAFDQATLHHDGRPS